MRVLILISGATPGSTEPLFASLTRAGVDHRTSNVDGDVLELLGEYRFDALVLLLGESSTPVALLDEIPGYLRIPVVAVGDGAQLRADEIVCWDRAETELPGVIQAIVSRARAAQSGGTAERVLIESVGAIIWRADPATFEFSFVSEEAEAILGYPTSDWLWDSNFWVDRIHPADRDWTVNFCVDATARGEDHAFEYRMVAADGSTVWIRDIVRVVDLDGRKELVGVMIDVTESRLTQERLMLRERGLNSVSDGILIVDARQRDHPIIYANEASQRLSGYSLSELEGRNCRMFHGPETDPETVAAVRSATEENNPITVEILNYRKDGSTFWNRLSVAPVQAPEGSVSHFVIMQSDISEAKTADDALRQSEERFRQVADNIEEVFWLGDRDQFHYISPGCQRIWGYSREYFESDPRRWFDSVHPDDRAHVKEAQADLLVTPREVTFRIIRPDGEIRWLESRSFPVRNEKGEIYRTAGVNRDITPLVRANEDLVRSEARYRRLVTNSPEMVDVLDLSGTIVEINRAGEEILNRPARELIGQPLLHFVASSDLVALEAGLRQIARGSRDRIDLDIQFLRPDGSHRLVHRTFVAIREDNEITGIHGIGRDVTEAKAREDRMKLLSSALDSLDQGVSIMALDKAQPLYRNRAWGRLLGCDPERIMEYDVKDFVPDGEHDQVEQTLAALRDTGQWRGRIWRKRQDTGEIVALDAMHGTAEASDGGTLILSIMHDASVEIEREQMMRRAERLASLGTLVGGVAHELNNPLHAIRTFAELLLDDDPSREHREMLEMTRREAERASNVVADLRIFARQTQDGSLSRHQVNLNDIVEHAVKVRAYTLTTHNVDIVMKCEEELAPIFADAREIEQLVFNLLINAEQAVAAEGLREECRIEVETTTLGEFAVLRIADSGPGIIASDLDQIFDPFFTTKAPGHGTGLGLSLVHRIVQEHGGEIGVESEPGAGTVFHVRLPLAKPDRSKGQELRPSPESAEGSLEVLVIDDEPSVRMVTAAYLKRRGHKVDTANDGAEALTMIAASEYDVVVSDLRMPGVDGASLLRILREQQNPVADRLFFLTGDPPLDPSTFDVPILAKPMRMEDVAALVEKLGGGESKGVETVTGTAT